MSNLNAEKNRVVWVDVPVVELDRAIRFYSKVLAIDVTKEKFGDVEFAVLAHDDGNGGCLMVQPENVGQKGPMVYFNANGRIRDAVEKVKAHGGRVEMGIHAIGPHGFRALLIDSEGNRVALHSHADE